MSARVSPLTEQERDSLTECECGHFAVEHSSTGCLATVYDAAEGEAAWDDVCVCIQTPLDIAECAMAVIVAARVEAALAERDAAWRITVGNFLRSDLERLDWAREALRGSLKYLGSRAAIEKGRNGDEHL